jgi:hypothetical protein
MIKADKHEQEFLHKVLEEWQANGQLTGEQVQQLKGSIVPKKDERQQLAGYFFIIALSCGLLAFGALFIDEKLLARFQKIFLLKNLTISIGAALLSVICFWQARRQRTRTEPATYELYLIPGTLTALISLVYCCKDIGNGASYSLFLGLATLLLLALSLGFRSRIIWLCFLGAAMGWYGAFSSAFSTRNLFLGMNYPLRFTIFGVLVLGLAALVRSIPATAANFKLTYHTGLLILFTGLWGLSVFGNYGYLDQWAAVRQTQVIGYAVVFGIAAGAGLYVGIRNNDAAIRDYSIFFLLLNLYTRYFEYFWNSMNKGFFFLVLAVSFWLLGRWLISRKKEIPANSQNG